MDAVPTLGGLAAEDLVALRDDPRAAFVVDRELTIRWVNHPLERWGPERGLLEAISGPQHAFYEELLRRALAANVPVDHDYECHTETEFRRFRMRCYPLRGEGLMLVHSLIEQRSHDAPPAIADDATYRDRDDIFHMCGHCRCTRRCGDHSVWDWVPAYVATPPPKVSHGLCMACFAYHYPPG